MKDAAGRCPHPHAMTVPAFRLTTNADFTWSFSGLPARLRAVFTGAVAPDITSGRVEIIA